MSVQVKTSPANGRGNAPAAEDITPAGSPLLIKGEDGHYLSGNPAPLASHGPSDGQSQAEADPDEAPEPTAPERGARDEAPQFELSSEETRQLPVDDIHADADIQVRARTDDEAVADYAERMGAGDTFPPIVVFFDGTRHWLADGFHRLQATRRAGLDTITAKVRPGGRREAIRHALGANLGHGLRRTNADKRRAVEIALKEFGDLSDRQIAEMCGVGNALVGDVRRQVCESNTSTVRTGRDGKKYAQKPAARRQLPPADRPTPVKISPPSLVDAVEQANPLGTVGASPDQDDADAIQFLLADGTNFDAGTWIEGWIGAEEAATKLRSLEATAKPLVPMDKEACASHQRILLGCFSTFNRELGPAPSHDALHRLADMLDTMAYLLRNTVVGHRNYHPAAEPLQSTENTFDANDDHDN